jgi:TPR repeat protein
MEAFRWAILRATPTPAPFFPELSPEECYEKALELDAQGELSAVLPYLRQAADQGYPKAMCLLGKYCLTGRAGASSDAMNYFRRAAQQGYVPEDTDDEDIQLMMGITYVSQFAPPDVEKALPILQRFADKDNSLAKANMAPLYMYGSGVPEDKDKAFQLTRDAADAGVDFALFNLGIAYKYGWGVTQDTQKSDELCNEVKTKYESGGGDYIVSVISIPVREKDSITYYGVGEC